MRSLLKRLYPDGLEGRRALDVACNNGAHLFAAKEAGAGTCRGFDVRDTWIEQARFLTRHRQGPSDDTHFDTCDVYDLPERQIEPADFTICAGLLYHLPDPIRALQIVAELTRGVLLLTSASVPGRRDGAFVAGQEDQESLLSGVYGLTWWPTGPATVTAVLRWIGFEHFRVWGWFRDDPQPDSPELDRFLLLAFRDEAALASWDANAPADPLDRMMETVTATAPPRAAVLVASDGDDASLKVFDRPGYERVAWHFPQDGAGKFIPGLGPNDSWPLMVQIDELRAKGAAVPGGAAHVRRVARRTAHAAGAPRPPLPGHH